MLAQQSHPAIQANQQLLTDRKNCLNSDYDKEVNLNVEDLRNQQLLGVSGKKSWPIRILSFLWLGATIAIVNIYGRRNGQISNKYYLYVTPPGLFFTVWAVIFALKAICNLINVFKNVWTLREHITLAINNILLIVWTFVFDVGNDPAVFCSFLILLSIIPVGLYFWYRAGQIRPYDWFTYLSRNSYAFYLGWIIAATNLNLGIIIVYWWKANYTTQLIIFWVMAPLCALGVTALNIYRQGLFGLKCCFALWLTVVWAFVGASITSRRCLTDGCIGA